jgi:serine/threonine protein phosphatase 1
MRYVIGDVHGCFKSLRYLVEEVLRLEKLDELYFVGDFIDRGPYGKDVLDYVMWLHEKGFQVQSVKGNHEEMLIDAYLNQNPEKYMLWMFNGAETTLASYGLESFMYKREGVVNELPEEHIDFIRKMPYYIELEDYFIVHAGINFKADDPFRDIHSMVWCRDCYNDLALSGNRKVVHGHTPVSLEVIREMNRDRGVSDLNVDAGCVYKGTRGMGNLVALDLDELLVRHTENKDF